MSMLAAARQAAEEANEAKDRLLAAASHALRQPLQTLRLLNGAMKRLASDPNMKDALLQEERALNTMSELLHALLNIAKLESGTMQPNLTDASLSAVFEDLRQQFAPLAKIKQLDLLVVTPDLHLRTNPVLAAGTGAESARRRAALHRSGPGDAQLHSEWPRPRGCAC